MNTPPLSLFSQGAAGDTVQSFPRPGRNTRVSVSRFGAAYSAPSNAQSFPHPWKPSLVASGVTLSKGTVQLASGIYEPQIDGVPISGPAPAAPPVLALDPTIQTAIGESWICVQFPLQSQPAGSTAAPVLPKNQVPIIVQSIVPVSLDPLTARWAVALVVWQGKNPYMAIEGAYFNAVYTRIIPAPGGGPVEHLFT